MDVSATTTIRRSPRTVWEYLCDASRDVNWRTGIVNSGLRTDEPAGKGSVGFVSTGRMTVVYRVTTFEPTSRMDWEYIEGPLEGGGSYRLEPIDDGTRFTLAASGRPSGAMRLLGPLFGLVIQRQMRTDVATLRSILESEATLQADRSDAEPAD